MTQIKAGFGIGQDVRMPGFIDCFGKTIEPIEGLKVQRIVYVHDGGMKPYFRLLAVTEKGRSFEAAERFFESAILFGGYPVTEAEAIDIEIHRSEC
jgi:hypothetical protein